MTVNALCPRKKNCKVPNEELQRDVLQQYLGMCFYIKEMNDVKSQKIKFLLIFHCARALFCQIIANVLQ